jgi:two-component system, cell cycle sensor histidine kinase and response regulator CckA
VPPDEPNRVHESILLVDDEDLVRRLIERILENEGYTVLSAASPEEGLRLSREHHVDAVVTDVAMPSMNGPAFVEALRQHRPELRVLFISGHTSEGAVELELRKDEVAFVQKPFTAAALASHLRQLLDA